MSAGMEEIMDIAFALLVIFAFFVFVAFRSGALRLDPKARNPDDALFLLQGLERRVEQVASDMSGEAYALEHAILMSSEPEVSHKKAADALRRYAARLRELPDDGPE